MNENDQDRMKKLLRKALPPIGREAEPERDLWPGMLRRLDAEPAVATWFDWALLAGLVGFAAFFPVSVPVLFYYL
ncbi:MAG: hypothetical protein WBQ94_23135 [Terracidiphilus sp.]